MSKHTPGPWEIGRPNRPAFADNGIWAGGFVMCDICNDGHGYDEQQANARLIASAPELLEALEWTARALDKEHPAAIKARIAIAKAKGEQP